MKKSILFVIALFPLLASCNNNSNGFVNPFPNDPYEHEKIGFNFAPEENIKRTLTTQESNLIASTVANINQVNGCLFKETAKIRIRDYQRAFAGVFGIGYNISNSMIDEDYSSFYQKEDTDRYLRNKKVDDVKSTYDYSYGQNVSEDSYVTLRVKAKKDNADTYSENKEDGDTVIDVDYDTKIGQIVEGDPSEDKPFYVSQEPYIFTPTTTDPIPGANADGEAILVREEHVPYGDSGEYELPDGRKYRAMNNSIYVSRLQKKVSVVSPSFEYYCVASVRKYSETVITSDVIQPNIPITFLAAPIVIHYEEEIHSFSTTVDDASTEGALTGIEVKGPEL